ncbi:MAG: hypothetical protein HOV73_23130, partial [Streptomyces sp.]|nr:hypothetical protein [Streptomyces sp.]
CVDIDATRDENNFELRAVLSPATDSDPITRAYAGIRDLQPNPGSYLWTDLSGLDDYPSDACGISIAQQALGGGTEGDVNIDVITTTGAIWETTCDVNNGDAPTLTCNVAWSLVKLQPTPGAMNSGV